ncbi:hypothetical protein B0H14DRAFT_2586565 [Mycena olivaceomarginata]|nr:hypothetical protein B0H14DRAFT_2586565 [Mycena olivaceomarginata]
MDNSSGTLFISLESCFETCFVPPGRYEPEVQKGHTPVYLRSVLALTGVKGGSNQFDPEFHVDSMIADFTRETREMRKRRAAANDLVFWCEKINRNGWDAILCDFRDLPMRSEDPAVNKNRYTCGIILNEPQRRNGNDGRRLWKRNAAECRTVLEAFLHVDITSKCAKTSRLLHVHATLAVMAGKDLVARSGTNPEKLWKGSMKDTGKTRNASRADCDIARE